MTRKWKISKEAVWSMLSGVIMTP